MMRSARRAATPSTLTCGPPAPHAISACRSTPSTTMSKASARAGPSEKPSSADHGSRQGVASSAATGAADAHALPFQEERHAASAAACAASAGVGRQQLGEMLVDEAGVEAAGAEVGLRDDRLEKGRVDPRADHDGVAERRGKPVERLAAGRAMGDHLGDHGIVIGRHHEARGDAGIDADAVAAAASSSAAMRPGDGRKPRSGSSA